MQPEGRTEDARFRAAVDAAKKEARYFWLVKVPLVLAVNALAGVMLGFVLWDDLPSIAEQLAVPTWLILVGAPAAAALACLRVTFQDLPAPAPSRKAWDADRALRDEMDVLQRAFIAQQAAPRGRVILFSRGHRRRH